MKIVAIGAAASSISSPGSAFWVAAEARFGGVDQSLRRALCRRRQALRHRLEELVLELLASIVVIALFAVLTDPETGEDC